MAKTLIKRKQETPPLKSLIDFLNEIPCWLAIGAFMMTTAAAVLWANEAVALRAEAMSTVKAKIDVLSKVLPNGKQVAQAIIPGTIAILRSEEGYFVCGRANVKP